MQFGEVDIFLLVLVGVAFAAVVIGVIVFALRRANALSDEFSKQAKAKFDAIKPGGAAVEEAGRGSLNPFMNSTRFKIPPPTNAIQKEEPTRPITQAPAVETRAPETLPSALNAELQETRNRLQLYMRDVAKERETARNEMEDLRGEARRLSEKLQASSLEIQKLTRSLEEKSTQLKMREKEAISAKAGREEIEKLRIEVQTLQRKLQTSSLEAQKLRENLEEQRARLKIRENAEAERARKETEGLRMEVQTLRAKLQASSIEIQKLRGSLEEQSARRKIQEIETSKTETARQAEKPAEASRERSGRRFLDVFRPRSICQYCDRQLEPRARFCDSCGEPVAAPIQNR